MTSPFPPGSLVSSRGREWVVLPDSNARLLMLQPLSGSPEETTGVLPAIEEVKSTHFDPPDSSRVGDHASCRLLRDAARLGIRMGAGPFRSFARIAVEPRAYQLVPLLMGLRLDPVRLLIADDVGIGKTIEAGLVAKELLERGHARKLAVLSPPHLAEQWQRELREKFHLEADLVLAGTAASLERRHRLAPGESIFEKCACTVVSLDYIKTERHREAFRRFCPDLVLVDEAHGCATGAEGRSQHLRHKLLREIASEPNRHIILVTATPHSGKEDAFRSLLSLLDASFGDLPDDLTGKENEGHRRRLAAHFVQRRRGDIRKYLDDETRFPARTESEESWEMSKEYRAFFDGVVDFARAVVQESGLEPRHERMRWWTMLGLLRAVGSSPAAAEATLRARWGNEDADLDLIDELGERAILDGDPEEDAASEDQQLGSDIYETDAKLRKSLRTLAIEVAAFRGKPDAKLARATKLCKGLLARGRSPILFCRFIATAEYLATELRSALPKDVEVRAVTGGLPPADRESQVEQLGEHEKRILVCTDCLSEGINLQEHFDAILHYDLSWNPTRHEQREGRVDRYGQPSDDVEIVTFYGANSPIDGIVLEVLLRKHDKIRTSLGISVPVPQNPKLITDALFEGLLLRSETALVKGTQELLPGFESFFKPTREDFHARWDQTADREKQSRTMFAQHALKPAEVLPELAAARKAIGTREDVRRFVTAALRAHDVHVEDGKTFEAHIGDRIPRVLANALEVLLAGSDSFKARFELPVDEGELYIARTHPIVETLCSFVLDSALDPTNRDSAGSRCGATRTNAVARRTTLLLARTRFQIHERSEGHEKSMLAEEITLHGFAGSPRNPEWLDEVAVDALVEAEPSGNLGFDIARDAVADVLEHYETGLYSELECRGKTAGDALLDAHQRVRKASVRRGSRAARLRYEVELKPPIDLLGCYVLLPVPKTGRRS